MSGFKRHNRLGAKLGRAFLAGALTGSFVIGAAAAQSLSSAPPVQGSGCASAQQRWGQLNGSDDTARLRAFVESVPLTCEAIRLDAERRISALHARDARRETALAASADAERQRARTAEAVAEAERQRVAAAKRDEEVAIDAFLVSLSGSWIIDEIDFRGDGKLQSPSWRSCVVAAKFEFTRREVSFTQPKFRVDRDKAVVEPGTTFLKYITREVSLTKILATHPDAALTTFTLLADGRLKQEWQNPSDLAEKPITMWLKRC